MERRTSRHLPFVLWPMAAAMAFGGSSASAATLAPFVVAPGATSTINGGDSVIGAGSGTGIRVSDGATLNFAAGTSTIQQVGLGIFGASGATGSTINFLTGSNVTITTVTATGLGLQSSSGSNTTFNLNSNSRVTLIGYQGVNLGHSPAGTVNKLEIGSGATLRIQTAPVAGGQAWAKGVMLSSNASVTVAANGVLDIETTGGQYARGVELGTSMTYPDAFDRRFTAAAGSTLRVKTTGLTSDGFYMLGAGEAVMYGTTDIHTTGNDSSGIFLYQYNSPVSRLFLAPAAGGTASIRTEGNESHGLIGINGSQAQVSDAAFQTSGAAAVGLYAYTAAGQTATAIQATRATVQTSGTGGFGLLAEGAASRITFDAGTVRTTGALGHGAVLHGASTLSATGSTIAASGAGAYGLLLASDTGTQQATFSGGTLSSAAGNAIGVDGGTANVTLTGTSVTGAGDWLRVAPSGSLLTRTPTSRALDPSIDPTWATPPAFTSAPLAAGSPALANVRAVNAQLSGTVTTDAGSVSNVTLVDSTWTMTGNSNITTLVNDPSLISFSAPQGGVFKTLTVRNYSGDGTIALNTYLGSDGSPSDKLVIDGGTATGTSKLSIRNAGGPGAQTESAGIMVVGAINGGTTAPGAFSLAEPVTAGAHEYLLYRGAATADQAQNWYLRSSTLVIDPETGEPETIPNYRPETAPAVIAPEIARQVAGRMLDTFHDRMGDQYALLSSGERKAGWARVVGQRLKQQWEGTVEPRFKGNLWIGQAGADLLERTRDDNLSDRLGLFGAYGQASGQVDGFVEGVHGASAGSLRLESYGLGLYWTRLKQTNWYWDNVLMGNYYTGRSRSDRGVRADLEGWGLTASSEAGYSFFPRSDLMLQPQVQLIYQYTAFNDTKDEYSSIRYSGGGAVTGRIGLLLQGNADQPEKIRPYARVNLWHRFSRGESVVFGASDAVRTEYGATSADLRVGLVAPMNKRTELYASAGYGLNLDGNVRQAYFGNVGVRYSW